MTNDLKTTSTKPKAKAYTKPAFPYASLPQVKAENVPKTVLMQVLYKALTLRRASGSATEAEFVAWLANRLPVSMVDLAGNIWVDLRTSPSHRTLFTAHSDTVHRAGGVNVVLDDGDIWRAGEGHCLGADDGAGIALMAHMISEGVPALYGFFRGEEVGGIGSSWAAENMPEVFKDIDRCISFDRAGYSDVITHQGSRCCSDEFGLALADALTTEDLTLAYSTCDTGVFTDSANFTSLVPEGTNAGVGYFRQHGDSEYQNVVFLRLLAEQLVKVSWDSLPTKRDTKAADLNSNWAGIFDADGYAKSEYKLTKLDLRIALEDSLAGYKAYLQEILKDSLFELTGFVLHDKFPNMGKRFLQAQLEMLEYTAPEELIYNMLEDLSLT